VEGDQGNLRIFVELEARLAEGEPKDPLKLKRDRWVAGVMVLGVALTVPSMFGASGELIAWVTLVGLVFELCALGVFAYRQVRDVAPEFRDAKRKFAVELDTQFVEYQRILAWLRSLPQFERDRRLPYIESRLQSMSLRYPIVFGAVDKLGFLPLLVGVFVQWQAIETVSIRVGLFAFFIFALYGMALWLARYRLQMQSYARLLRAAESGDSASVAE
jgi:hypothetical protein